MTVMPLELWLGLSNENLLMKAINRSLLILTRVFPKLFGYQCMFVARSVSPGAHRSV